MFHVKHRKEISMNISVSNKVFVDAHNKGCRVELVKNDYNYHVIVDGEEYYSSPNRTFAQQVFNAI